jgi:3-dehydroquinate dehydratase type I
MKKKFQICTVVQGKNLVTFVKNLKKAQASAGMVELRADSIKDFDSDDLPIVKGPTKLPSIFTFRHKKEGGLYAGPISRQKEILKDAFDFGFTYVDVACDNPILEELNTKEKKQLLLSYHNNEETPYLEDLLDLLEDMRAVRPAIIKIATQVTDYDDIPILAALLKKAKKDEKLVVIGMGRKGEITRLTFPSLGSHIAYVTMKGEKNIAPGMLTEAQLKPVINYFKNH